MLLIIAVRCALPLEKIGSVLLLLLFKITPCPKQLRNIHSKRESQMSAFFYLPLLDHHQIPAQRRFQKPSHDLAGRVYRVHDIFHGEAEGEEKKDGVKCDATA